MDYLEECVPAPPLVPVLPDGIKPIPLGSGTIVSILGEGGVAVVYKIWNETLGIKRAVKLLRTMHNPNVLQRFYTEMRVTAQFSHPNIVAIHSVGEWHGLPYIEMELIDGKSLDAVIRERGTLPPAVITALGIMICRALVFTHSHPYECDGTTYPGMLHRDLKPHNIMLENNGTVKITDFGTATPTNVSLNTLDGMFIGSLLYVAPEQLLGGHGDERSDIYSLGCILYECVTGRKVFTQLDIARLISDRSKNSFVHLSSFKLKIPAALEKCIEQCLQAENKKRIRSAENALGELEKIHRQLTRLQPEQVVRDFLNSAAKPSPLPQQYQFSAARGVLLILTLTLTVFFSTILIIRAHDAVMKKNIVKKQPHSESKPLLAEQVTGTPVQPDTTEVPAQQFASGKKSPVKQPARIRDMAAPPESSWPHPLLMAAPVDPSTLTEALKDEYHTKDMLMILSGELHKGRYIRAWQTYSALESIAQQKRSRNDPSFGVTVSTYRRQLDNFFEYNAISEPEFCMVKARMLYLKGDYSAALPLLTEAHSAIPANSVTSAVERTIIYFLALTALKIYQQDPTDSRREQLLNYWIQVKKTFSGTAKSPYAQAAEYQIRRLKK